MLEISSVSGSSKQSPIRKIMEMAERKNIINMGLNPDDIISFAGGWVNHEAPEGLREEYREISNNKELFHKAGEYSPTEGLLELRKNLADMSKEIFGTDELTENNILIGQSSTQLTFSLFLTILNPNDKVLLFDPTYANYPEQLYVCQKNIITLKVFDKDSWSYMKNEDTILSSLEYMIKTEKPKLILVSSPDNPTGQILSDYFINEMLKIALKYDCYVAIDNAYETLYYTESPPKHFSFSPENYENLIKIHSNSKWCRGLGRRLGWVEASKDIIKAMKNIQQAIILCPDTIHQVTLSNYIKHSIEDGSLRKYLEENRNKYKKASEFTSDCIEKYLDMRYLKPKGGLYTVIDAGMDGDMFVHDILKNTGVILVPGRGFGESLKNGVRVSFGPLVNNIDMIEEGFSKIKDFIEGRVTNFAETSIPCQSMA